MISILPVRTLRQQRVKSQGQSQVAGEQQRWDLYPDNLAPNPPSEFYSRRSRGRESRRDGTESLHHAKCKSFKQALMGKLGENSLLRSQLDFKVLE